MAGQTPILDMTLMYAMHSALRRDLTRIARITARRDDDPRRILRAAAGWELFKRYLTVHHTVEDDALWPVMRRELADRPDDLLLMEAMETEHAEIEPLLEEIDLSLADPDGGPARLADLTDALAASLTGHLRHEEGEALPLIDVTLTSGQWQFFLDLHRDRLGTEIPRYFPWLLDDASDETMVAVLGLLPEPVRVAYQDQWRPTYRQLDAWSERP